MVLKNHEGQTSDAQCKVGVAIREQGPVQGGKPPYLLGPVFSAKHGHCVYARPKSHGGALGAKGRFLGVPNLRGEGSLELQNPYGDSVHEELQDDHSTMEARMAEGLKSQKET